MSRSIHETRASFRRELRQKYSDRSLGSQRLEEVARKIERKRRIKEQVKGERATPRTIDLPPVPIECVPIRVSDAGTCVHYPASEADIRQVLSVLPPGIADGIRGIELCLGTWVQDRAALEKDWSSLRPDPHVGRNSMELVPGVFSGPVFGTYSPANASIRVFAFVYSPDVALREVFEPYLRMLMLETLVHEVAHHHDARDRVARGRWLAREAEKCEELAERLAYRWSRDHVVPYLRRTYARGIDLLERWIHHHGGARIAIHELLRFPGREEGMAMKAFFPAADAFEHLIRNVGKSEDLSATRLQFARELHYGENYSQALEAIEQILKLDPKHPGARTLRADIFEHQEKHVEAAALAEEVVTEFPGQLDAWKVLVDAREELQDWSGVIEASLRAGGEGGSVDEYIRVQRARALLELGELDRLSVELAPLLASRNTMVRRGASGLQGLAHLRSGRLKEALQVANEGLVEGGRPVCHHVLRAVQADAARRLGGTGPLPTLPASTMESLRRQGYGSWVDQLLMDHGNSILTPVARPGRKSGNH